MNPKYQFISNLTAEQTETLRQHFDTIYECPEMTEHEYKIAYLAWLWANEKVSELGDHDFVIDEKESGLKMDDLAITFEDDYEHGGISLQYLYEYYSFGQIFEKMKW